MPRGGSAWLRIPHYLECADPLIRIRPKLKTCPFVPLTLPRCLFPFYVNFTHFLAVDFAMVISPMKSLWNPAEFHKLDVHLSFNLKKTRAPESVYTRLKKDHYLVCAIKGYLVNTAKLLWIRLSPLRSLEWERELEAGCHIFDSWNKCIMESPLQWFPTRSQSSSPLETSGQFFMLSTVCLQLFMITSEACRFHTS